MIGGGEGRSTALTPVMVAVTEKGGDGTVLTREVQPETKRERSETKIERGGRATAESGKGKETVTKAERGGKGVKTGREEGV